MEEAEDISYTYFILYILLWVALSITQPSSQYLQILQHKITTFALFQDQELSLIEFVSERSLGDTVLHHVMFQDEEAVSQLDSGGVL